MKILGNIKVAAVSPNFKIADVSFNLNEIIKVADELNKNSVEIAVFPELSLTGYTCGDLFFQQSLLNSVSIAIDKIKQISKKLNVTLIIGAPLKNFGKLYNCAVVISKGVICGVVPKTYLCNYNEYYEDRWFSSGDGKISDFIFIENNKIPFGNDLIFCSNKSNEIYFGAEICEDLWAINPPSNDLAISGANIIFNLSATNELLGKNFYRENLVKFQSSKLLSAYIYTSSNANESSTDTTFSGHLMICENGNIISQKREFSFETTFITGFIDIQLINNERFKNKTFGSSKTHKNFRIIEVDFDYTIDAKVERLYSQTPFIPNDIENRNLVCQEISQLQATALAKRLKHTNLKKSILGISGGLDSTLALLSTVKAYQKLGISVDNILAITMPGFGTTERTKNNAINLIKELKISHREINIKKSVEQHFEDINHPFNKYDIVYENSQARERTQILMDIANQENGIVVGTGDLSEYALGWCTYNGDQMSMYGINAGIPKTLIKYIIEWYANQVFNDCISNILKDIINTPISPELLPPDKEGNIIQNTETSIGPYILNDFILFYFLRYNFSPEKILVLLKKTFKNDFKTDFLKNVLINFYKRFFNNQYKRSAMPDGVKIGSVSLSPRTDWRMPSDAEFNDWLEKIK